MPPPERNAINTWYYYTYTNRPSIWDNQNKRNQFCEGTSNPQRNTRPRNKCTLRGLNTHKHTECKILLSWKPQCYHPLINVMGLTHQGGIFVDLHMGCACTHTVRAVRFVSVDWVNKIELIWVFGPQRLYKSCAFQKKKIQNFQIQSTFPGGT